jgi:hypothetical protein
MFLNAIGEGEGLTEIQKAAKARNDIESIVGSFYDTLKWI